MKQRLFSFDLSRLSWQAVVLILALGASILYLVHDWMVRSTIQNFNQQFIETQAEMQKKQQIESDGDKLQAQVEQGMDDTGKAIDQDREELQRGFNAQAAANQKANEENQAFLEHMHQQMQQEFNNQTQETEKTFSHSENQNGLVSKK